MTAVFAPLLSMVIVSGPVRYFVFGGHSWDGGEVPWPVAKSLRYLTLYWISFWLERTRRPLSTLVVCWMG
jgi:hypothetical protein